MSDEQRTTVLARIGRALRRALGRGERPSKTERGLRAQRADEARRAAEQAGNEARGRDLGGMYGPF